jgi:hypothetical protein
MIKRLFILFLFINTLAACTSSPLLPVNITVNGQIVRPGTSVSFPANQDLNIQASFVLPESDKNMYPVPQELVSNPLNYDVYGFLWGNFAPETPSTSQCGPYPFFGTPASQNVDSCDPANFTIEQTLDQIEPAIGANRVSTPAKAAFDAGSRRITVNIKVQTHKVEGQPPGAGFQFDFVYIPKGIPLTQWRQARRFIGSSGYIKIE